MANAFSVAAGLIASLFPVRLKPGAEAAGGSFGYADVAVLNDVLVMNEHNLADRYGFLPADRLAQLRARWGLVPARAAFVTKQGLHASAHFTRALNEIMRTVILAEADPLLKAHAVLCLKHAGCGNNAFNNIMIAGDAVAVGNNTFCHDVAGFRRLVTFGQAGCVVMLARSGARQAFMHFSIHPHYQSVMAAELAAWLKAGDGEPPEVRIISHQPGVYADMIRAIAPGARLLAHEKAKIADYDVLFDGDRAGFLVSVSPDGRSLAAGAPLAFVPYGVSA